MLSDNGLWVVSDGWTPRNVRCLGVTQGGRVALLQIPLSACVDLHKLGLGRRDCESLILGMEGQQRAAVCGKKGSNANQVGLNKDAE